MNRTKISAVQLAALIIGSRMMMSYTFLPVVTLPPANQDTWIVSIVAAIFLTVLSIPMMYIVNKNKGKTDLEVAESLFGKVLGKTAACLFVVFSLFCFFSCILMDVVFLKSSIFPETPTWGFAVYILIPIAYTAYRGIGTIGRVGTLIVFYIAMTILLFFLLSLSDMDLNNLRPILADSRIVDIGHGAFLDAATKSEVFFFFVLGYFLEDKSKINHIFFAEIIINLVFELLMVIPTLSVLGVELSKHATNAYFLFTKQISAYDFIQRVESLNVLAWFLGSLLRSSIFCFMASYVLSSVFGKKKKNQFVIPFCILLGIILMLPSVATSGTIDVLISPSVMPWIIFPFAFLVPSTMAVISIVRNKLAKRKKAGGTD